MLGLILQTDVLTQSTGEDFTPFKFKKVGEWEQWYDHERREEQINTVVESPRNVIEAGGTNRHGCGITKKCDGHDCWLQLLWHAYGTTPAFTFTVMKMIKGCSWGMWWAPPMAPTPSKCRWCHIRAKMVATTTIKDGYGRTAATKGDGGQRRKALVEK